MSRVLIFSSILLSFCLFLSSESKAQTVQIRVAANNDDSEESSTGTNANSGTTLRLGQQQWVGMRFRDVAVPQGATILSAYVEMTASATSSTATNLTIYGQSHDSPPDFENTASYISGLPKTTASVLWEDIEPWTSGQTYQSADISQVVQELVDRSGWTTASELNVLMQSNDLTGSRTCHSYNGSAASAPLLVVEYTTSTASNTPTSDRLYVETMAYRKASAANTWLTVDLSGAPFNVPANKVVEIAVLNVDSGNERWGGVRAVGSSLERRFQLHEAESGGVDSVVMHVQANANSEIQIYTSSTTYIYFLVIGYWTTGTYTETMQSFTLGSTGSWVDRNLSTYGVGANQVAEVVMTNGNTSNEYNAGVRAKGSSLARLATIHEAQDGGIDAATLLVKANNSSDATIQAWSDNNTAITFYVVGYWPCPPGKFTEKYTNLGVPTSTSTWQDKSLTSVSVPAKAVAVLQTVNTEAGAENSLGVRENGSSNSRRFALHQAKDGGGDYSRMHVTTDSSSIIEWFAQDINAANIDFLLTGYWEAAPANVLVVVANKQSPSAQALARLALLDGWNYSYTLIDDDDLQSSYTTALANHPVVYVTAEVGSGVAANLNDAAVGIVSEQSAMISGLSLGAGSVSSTATNLTISDNTHYITSPFTVGSRAIFSSAQPVNSLSGDYALQLQAPAYWGVNASLLALEAGAMKFGGGGKIAGRRVQLPWGGSAMDIAQLNNDGKTILQRSLQWAGGLKAYWKLDETSGTVASDSSGNQNNATLSSGKTFSIDAVLGKRNGGLSFSGSSGYVSASPSPSLELSSAITLSVWINPTSLGTAYLFNKNDQSSFYLRSNSNGSISFGNGVSGFQVTSGVSVIQAGTWQHVAATYDQATGTGVIYVGGTAVTTQTGLTGAIGINASPLVLGSNNGGTSDRFAGVLDDARIYNYALSQKEIDRVRRSAVSGVRIIKWVETQ